MGPRSGAGVSSGPPSVAFRDRVRRPLRSDPPQKGARSAEVLATAQTTTSRPSGPPRRPSTAWGRGRAPASALGHPRSPSGIGRGVRLALTRLKRAPGALKCSRNCSKDDYPPFQASAEAIHGMGPRSGAGVSSGPPSVAFRDRVRRPLRSDPPQKGARSAEVLATAQTTTSRPSGPPRRPSTAWGRGRAPASALCQPRSPSGIGFGVRLALTRLKRAPGALKCSCNCSNRKHLSKDLTRPNL